MNFERLQKRRDHWQVYLCKYAEQQIGKDFIWNETHCTALICGCIDAMFGTDHFEMQKRDYPVKNWSQASELCANRLTRTFLEQLGFTTIDSSMVSCGDIVYHFDENRGIEGVHICVGNYVITSDHRQGVQYLQTREIKENGWEVLRWDSVGSTNSLDS